MKNIVISQFESCKSVYPECKVTLWKWLFDYKNEYGYLIDKLRKTNDLDLRKELKVLLPAITPSGIFYMRNATTVEKYSGIICIDIDGKDNLEIISFIVDFRQEGKEYFV